MKRRILIMTLAIMLIGGQVAYALPQGGTQEASNSVTEAKSKLDEVLTKIAEMESDVQKIDYEVNAVESSTQAIGEEIESIKEELIVKQQEIETKKVEIKKQQELLKNKARSSYINNSNDSQQLLKIILSSSSIKDLAQKFIVVREVVKSNKEVLDRYNEAKNELDKEEKNLNEKKESLSKKLDLLNKQYKELQTKKEMQEDKIDEFRNIKMQYEDEIRQNEVRIAESVENIKVNSNNATSSNSSEMGSILVNNAFKYLGVPYVWGGSTPSGFDCSGFIQYVYRESGIELSRTTYTQINEGYAVSDLRPGDLVFFGTYSNPYHVGMYIGNGQYIHSPTTGDVVKVANLNYRKDFCGGRRYY